MKLALFAIWASNLFAMAYSSAHCVKWRSTRNCDPHDARDSRNDLPCNQAVPPKLSGYCECEGRRRVRESTCGHHTFTCEKACEEDYSAKLQYPEDFEHVTCGSIIKLAHEMSRFRLHSQDISYGSGSQQQSVTAVKSRDDVDSNWIVKEGDGEPACVTGDKIQCGSTIRLEHANTRRNLHSHEIKAPVTESHFEVSAYGVAGEGDALDTWVLECVDNQQCTARNQCQDDATWMRGELVRLRHAATGAYLFTSHKHMYDDSNCPRCPIVGHQEVSTVRKNTDQQTLWFVDEGIFVAH